MRGPRDLAHTVATIQHPARDLLHHLRHHGASITLSTPPWTPSQLLMASERGSHPSTLAHAEFLRNEMADLIAQHFWIILPYDLVCHIPNLRLSPMGVVPQRERRPRIIVDYTYSRINLDTVAAAPSESMQFGHAFDRILHKIHHANRAFGPIYLIKVDLADGFYRMALSTAALPTLGVAFPNLPHEPALVALPLVLPMGWVESPPLFCAITETITDCTNIRLRQHDLSTNTHRLTHIADHPANEQPIPFITSPNPPHPRATPTPYQRQPILPRQHRHPLAYADVYMDDFIVTAQGHPHLRNQIRTTLFDEIDNVLRPLSTDDTSFHRQEPISIKKLNKGDARWTTRKVILGWVLDTYKETISLPPHRAQRLLAILDHLISRRRIAFKAWQKQLGEIQSMILALPGGRGLFSTLYTCFADGLQTNRVRLSRPIRDALLDLRDLADDLQSRPTRIGEIADSLPVAYGTADASGLGMGGIWLSADPSFPPFVWRTSFPRNVSAHLVTTDNLTGTITNSDLELAGQIAGQDVLLQAYDCRERTIATFTDNISARAWQRRGSVTTLGPAAYLLRIHSFLQRHYRYRSTSDYLPGPLNVMADDASRRWDLSDTQLISHFNSSYPQDKPWQLFILRPAMLSSLISALFCVRCARASYLPEHFPATLPGFDGSAIAAHSASHPTASTSGIHFPSSKSLPTATEPALSRPAVNLSSLARGDPRPPTQHQRTTTLHLTTTTT